MGIADWFKWKRKAPAPAEKPLDTDRLDKIAAFIRERYSRPVVRIKTEKADGLGLTDSKFGGFPYWEKGRERPAGYKGEPLLLLAQINFEKERLCHPLLPQKGILQFFVEADDLFGMDLKHPTQQDSFRVVYHETVDETVTPADVTAAGITANTQLDEQLALFPFYREYRLRFEEGLDTVDYCAEDEYNAAVANALQALFGETLEGSVLDHFTNREYDYLSQKLSCWGHKLLGYPNFTQWDPRNSEAMAEFDTLLFQMDSEGKDILWGDCGVANFFINHDRLKNLDFSKVWYNWDCY